MWISAGHCSCLRRWFQCKGITVEELIAKMKTIENIHVFTWDDRQSAGDAR